MTVTGIILSFELRRPNLFVNQAIHEERFARPVPAANSNDCDFAIQSIQKFQSIMIDFKLAVIICCRSDEWKRGCHVDAASAQLAN